MRTTASILSLILVFLLASAVSSVAEDVTIEVTSISAATVSAERAEQAGGALVDPRIKALAPKLQSLFAYNRYSFLGEVRSAAEFGDPLRLTLPEHFILEIRPERFERETGRIEMMVTLMRDMRTDRTVQGRGRPREEVILRTKIRLENGGTVLLGGPPISDGVLILALSARG